MARRGGRLDMIRAFVQRNASVGSLLLGPAAPIVGIAGRELTSRQSDERAAAATTQVRRAVRKMLGGALMAGSSPRFGFDSSVKRTLIELADDLRANHDGQVWVSGGHAERFRILAADLVVLSSSLAADTTVDVPFLPEPERESLRRLHTALAEAAGAAKRLSELHAEIAWYEERNTEADPIASVRLGKRASNQLPGQHATYARAVTAAVEAAQRLTPGG